MGNLSPESKTIFPKKLVLEVQVANTNLGICALSTFVTLPLTINGMSQSYYYF